jgi:hypothetical protein
LEAWIHREKVQAEMDMDMDMEMDMTYFMCLRREKWNLENFCTEIIVHQWFH